VAVISLLLEPGRFSAQPNLTVLSSAREVHQLTAEQAARHYPVLIRGVVTFCDESIGQLFVQDESGGIFVEIHGSYGFELQTGQLLQIEGISVPGGFAPDIEPRHIKLLGKAPMPPARAVTYEKMAAGQEDCNWVEFSGVVRSVGPDPFSAVGLKLAGGGGQVLVPIKNPDRPRCQGLVDAEVTIRGVCIAHFNRRGQLIQVAVQISNMDDISVRTAAPTDPFGMPARKISQLLQYAPADKHGHRVKVVGVVTLQRPGEALVIADETQGVYVQTTQITPVMPGDSVEALGFPGAGEYIAPVLQDAVFRKVGSGAPLAPLTIAAANGNRDTNHAALVQIEALVLNHFERRGAELLELQSGATIFDAELKGSHLPGSVPDGSRVRVTGICLVPEDQNWLSPRPQSFSLLLRTPVDVLVLERPSWWNVRHTLWVLAGTLAVFLASVSWAVMLRKQVKAQTRLIARKIQREAAFEERTRIARDLHDDLGASLTQIGFLSEVARKEKDGPAAVQEHLQEISSSAQEAFQSLDEIVWVANPRNDSLDSLANYVCHFAAQFFHDTSTRCRFDLPARLPDQPVAADLRNNLFFAVKEALNNVRKHAGASEVTLRISLMETRELAQSGTKVAAENGPNGCAGLCCISIEDNGRGFTPGAVSSVRNGLENMRQRLKKIGGEVLLESRPGLGTKVRLTVPVEAIS
jgi:signal transduction histidine kinase